MKSGLLDHASDYHGSCSNVKIQLDEPEISNFQHWNSNVSLWKSQLPYTPKYVSYCNTIFCGNIICIFIGLIIISTATHSAYSSWLWTKLLINHNYRYYYSCDHNHDNAYDIYTSVNKMTNDDSCNYQYIEYNLDLHFLILKCSYLGYPLLIYLIIAFFSTTRFDQVLRVAPTVVHFGLYILFMYVSWTVTSIFIPIAFGFWLKYGFDFDKNTRMFSIIYVNIMDIFDGKHYQLSKHIEFVSNIKNINVSSECNCNFFKDMNKQSVDNVNKYFESLMKYVINTKIIDDINCLVCIHCVFEMNCNDIEKFEIQR